MKMCGTFSYLGIETFKGKDKESVFQSLCLLQGTDVTKVFLKPEDLVKINGLIPMENVNVELEIKVGNKTFISLNDIKKAVIKAA